MIETTITMPPREDTIPWMNKISDVEWELADNHGSFLRRKTIYIGMPVKHDLTDDEVNEFVTDSITHEFIHHILTEVFPRDVTYLFDAIGDRLRSKELTKKYSNNFHIK